MKKLMMWEVGLIVSGRILNWWFQLEALIFKQLFDCMDFGGAGVQNDMN